MHTCLAHSVTYRNTHFLNTSKTITWSGYKFLTLKDFQFLKVDTDKKITNKPLSHGHYTGYTRNTTRHITMTFGCFAYTEQERFDLIKFVSHLFEPPQNPTQTEQGYYPLTFTEPNGKQRTGSACVVERIDPSDYDNENRITFSVKLLIKDNTCLFSNITTLKDRNHVMGMTLAEELSFPFRYANAIPIDYQGVSEAPVTCHIKALIDNPNNSSYLLIRSYKGGDKQSLIRLENLVLNKDDEVLIDTTNARILKNGFDISGNIKLPFDQYPTVQNLTLENNEWDNLLVVDCGNPLHVLDVTRTFRDTRC